MRESIGSTWVFMLVIVFILLFVSFLTLALTYSKSFKTKNELINIIEKYEGVSSDSVKVINNYLSYTGYDIKGQCPSDNTGKWLASTNLKANTLVKAQNGQEYFYCVRRDYTTKPVKGGKSKKNLKSVYYEIVIFYRFNLPIIDTVTKFKVDGLTGDIVKTNDYFDKVSFN